LQRCGGRRGSSSGGLLPRLLLPLRLLVLAPPDIHRPPTRGAPLIVCELIAAVILSKVHGPAQELLLDAPRKPFGDFGNFLVIFPNANHNESNFSECQSQHAHKQLPSALVGGSWLLHPVSLGASIG
jgi:hypothetical protein